MAPKCGFDLSPQMLKVIVEVFDELVVGVVVFVPFGEGCVEGIGDGVDLWDGGFFTKSI